MTLAWSSDIESATLETFRTVLFTGKHTQLTVMHLAVGEEIGLEAHEEIDQFIRVESGRAKVTMGPAKDAIEETHELEDADAAEAAHGH